MIKPPFTILILKEGRHPVTVRITLVLMLFFCVGIPIITGLAGFGISELLARTGVTRTLHTKISSGRPGVATTSDSAGTTVTGPSVDIDGLFVSFVKGGGMEVSFRLTGETGNGKVYVWLVMNPDSRAESGMQIHPRSPVFRGLPLDFRNGVVFDPLRERTCIVQVPEFSTGVSVDSLRVLVYAEEGTMLADKKFSIGRSPGT